MSTPEFISTETNDVQLIDTSPLVTQAAASDLSTKDLVLLLGDARHRICNDAPRQVAGKLLAPLENPVYGPLLRRLDAAAASVPQLQVNAHARAIRAAIDAIRDTTSRAQAISILEGLLGGSNTPAPTARDESSRALKIADEAMFNVLSSNCVPGDHHRTVLGLVDIFGCEVNKLEEADPQIREAFEWLRLRGHVQLANDGLGDHIVVMRRLGEE